MLAEQLVSELSSDSNYRVLRRVPSVVAWNLQPATGDTVRACIVDTETTGTGPDDEVIELAILPFDYCKETGRVVAVHPGFSSFRQPSKPIPAEATEIHGITDEMVAGCSIPDEQVAAAVGGAKLLIAFKAEFDRAKVAPVWPLLDTIPWGCAYTDVAWKEPGKLGWVLFRMGYFHDGHRAMEDCVATLFALTQPRCTSLLGEHTALFALLQKLREPLYKVMLFNTPYSSKDAIKARGGYRWDDKHRDGKTWWKLTGDSLAEADWFSEVCGAPLSDKDRLGYWVDLGRMPREPFARSVKVPPVMRHSTKVESL